MRGKKPSRDSWARILDIIPTRIKCGERYFHLPSIFSAEMTFAIDGVHQERGISRYRLALRMYTM